MTDSIRVVVLVIISVGAGCSTAAQLFRSRPHPAELSLMRGTIPDSLLESPQYHDFQRVMLGKPGQAGGMGALLISSPVYQITAGNDTVGIWRNIAVVLVDANDAAIAQSGLFVGMNCYYLKNQ